MSYYDDFLSATQALIAIDSVERAALPGAPFGKGVNDALIYTLQLADRLGFTTVNGKGYYGYAEVGKGKDLFGMLGHLDTVPIGNDWSYPPLGGVINNGIMYGRGILDDKAPILACMFATAELLSEGHIPNKRIRLIFGCDEESGWECINAYTAKEDIPDMAFTPDGDFPVIYAEKGIYYYDISAPLPDFVLSIKGGDRPNMVMDRVEIKFACGSLAHANKDDIDTMGGEINGDTLIFHGKSAHGSTPKKGSNALIKLLKLLASADHFGLPYAPVFSKLYDKLNANDGKGVNINRHDEYTGNTTMNIGVATTDNDHNLHISLDIRTPINVSRDEITAILTEQLDICKVKAGFYHDPLFVDPTTALVTGLQSAYAEVTSDNSAPIGIGGGTYARALPYAVAFGPIFPGQDGSIHEKDEHCSLDNLRKMYAVYKTAINNICFCK